MVYDGTGIHSTAIVSAGAEIGDGTIIGPYSLVGPNVKIGKNNRIASHVVIEGRTTIGDENVIYQFASVGSDPQDLKYKGEPSTLIIGDKNLVREYVTLQPGTKGGGMCTRIGNGNLFMVSSHVGHDALIGDSNVFANCCALAGHVTVGNKVTLGGLCGIHQFVRLGDFSILGAGSMVTKDVPPFCLAQGDRASLIGLNLIGLERKGMSVDNIGHLKSLYRKVFSGDGLWKERVEEVKRDVGDFAEGRLFVEFLASSSRGVTLPRRAGAANESD